MSATSFNEYHFKEISGSRELRLRGYNVKTNEFLIANYLPDPNFAANPIDTFFTEGLEYNPQGFYDWAASNGFKLYEQGQDLQGPVLLSVAVNGGKTVVTLTFDGNINKTGNSTQLKAAVTVSHDGGTTYAALGGSDSVGTVDGTGNTLAITFASALTTATNVIKIAAGAIEDVALNLSAAITTKVFDVKPPVATIVPANSATGFSRTAVITITFDEPVFNADGTAIQQSDLAAKLVLKLTNSSGSDVPFTASINTAATIITIDPNATLAATTVHYVALVANTVQDKTGNKTGLTTSSFTTGS